MSVHLNNDGVIRLEGPCPVDDADRLLQLLLTHREARIDWRDCDSAHTAVVQLIAVAGRPILGPPRDPFMAQHVHPALGRLEQGRVR